MVKNRRRVGIIIVLVSIAVGGFALRSIVNENRRAVSAGEHREDDRRSGNRLAATRPDAEAADEFSADDTPPLVSPNETDCRERAQQVLEFVFPLKLCRDIGASNVPATARFLVAQNSDLNVSWLSWSRLIDKKSVSPMELAVEATVRADVSDIWWSREIADLGSRPNASRVASAEERSTHGVCACAVFGFDRLEQSVERGRFYYKSLYVICKYDVARMSIWIPDVVSDDVDRKVSEMCLFLTKRMKVAVDNVLRELSEKFEFPR